MSREKLLYDDKCEVICIDTDKMVIAEVHRYEHEKMLTVVLERTSTINMRYNPRHKIYVGNAGGLEFTSEGPRIHVVRKGR